MLRKRFDPDGSDRSLVVLASKGCDLDEWKPLLLWHITRNDFLLREFLQQWLFPRHQAGAYRIHIPEVLDFARSLQRSTANEPWNSATLHRVASGLVKIAADFELLQGGNVKEFRSFHLPERSFLYLLHAIRERKQSPLQILESPDWRMFLMSPADVEHELLRLHQFRKLDYQVAGSLVQLSLPCSSSLEYAETMVA